jgi:hypothetical protein
MPSTDRSAHPLDVNRTEPGRALVATARDRSRRASQERHPDLGGPSTFGLVGLAAQTAGLFEDCESAFDFAALLVATVLFPDLLCGRRRWGSTTTGANGPAVTFSGT